MKALFSSELCQMHYTRKLRHGDPAVTLQRMDPVEIVDGQVPLASGGFAIIDVEDTAPVSAYKWTRGRYYVQGTRPGAPRPVLLHRLVMPTEGQLDHRNRDPLDNRKANLRPATRSQNNANKAKQGSQPYKGIRPCGARWRAVIQPAGRQRGLGTFDTAEEAARAYDAAAEAEWGEYAATNQRLGLLGGEACA